MAFKYVVLRAANRELPIIFPDSFVHSMVADTIRAMMVIEADEMAHGLLSTEAKAKLLTDVTVASAGEINLGMVTCFGKSDTLKVGSRHEDDNALILGFPYFHGIIPEEEGEGE